MAKATQTIKQQLCYKSAHSGYFAATKDLFNQITAFYFEVISLHEAVLDLSKQEALSALEKLTHPTKSNPHPLMPLSDAITADIPTIFRRAAIHAALGSARSFYSHLSKWRKRREKAVVRGKKFTIRPPVPPRRWNKSVTLYAGQWKGRTARSILLKLWTGRSWAWIKCGLQGRDLPDGWDVQSPTLVQDGQHWKLHTAVEKKFSAPYKVQQQINTNAQTRLCTIDLNITKHLAVCTVLTVEGTVVATRFIGGGKQLHGLRKRQLGRIARNRSKTGIIAKDEQDNADRNAAIVIGKRLLARYQISSQEKPHAPLRAERPVKTGGVRRSQKAGRVERPSTNPTRHGRTNAQGTTQDGSSRMGEDTSGIARQLRLFNE